VTIELLDSRHDRSLFDCEEPSLTDYIRKQAGQDVRKQLCACFVATDDALRVIGFYTLSSHSLGRDSVPEQYAKVLPRNYSAPVILLGRLARDFRAKGSGLGEHLLLDALFRSYRLSKQSLGAMAVVVDPISEDAVSFYGNYGFIELPDSPKMFLAMKTIGALFENR